MVAPLVEEMLALPMTTDAAGAQSKARGSMTTRWEVSTPSSLESTVLGGVWEEIGIW